MPVLREVSLRCGKGGMRKPFLCGCFQWCWFFSFFVVVCFVVVWIHFVQLLLLGFPLHPGDGESNWNGHWDDGWQEQENRHADRAVPSQPAAAYRPSQHVPQWRCGPRSAGRHCNVQGVWLVHAASMGQSKFRINTQRSYLALKIHNTGTTTKTWITYGNSQNEFILNDTSNQNLITELILRGWKMLLSVISVICGWDEVPTHCHSMFSVRHSLCYVPGNEFSTTRVASGDLGSLVSCMLHFAC